MNYFRSNKKRILVFIISLAIFIGCAYYNTMFNAFKMYDEGNLKIANSRDGKINADIRKSFNAAIDKCWTLINVHGDSSKWADDALLLIGKSHYLIEDYNKADRFLNQFIKKYPKSELLPEAKIWYAKVLVKTEEKDKALVMLNELLLNDMDNDLKAEALNSIGSIYYLREDYDQAIKNLKQCVDVSDDEILSATSQYQIGKIYYDLEKYVDAIENFNKVLDYDPPEELEFNTLMNKVDAQIKLDKLDLAMNTLSQMMRNSKIKDKHSLVEAKMGELFVLQDRQEYATEHFFDVISRYPNSLGSAWSTFQLAQQLENFYFDADSARKMYLKVRQESGKSDYVDRANERANLLKKYIDIKTSIKQSKEDIKQYTKMLLDSAYSDSTTDSLIAQTTPSDSDSVATPQVKETKDQILKKIKDAESKLTKERYNLAEFFLLTMQENDSATTAYVKFIETGLDTARIPKAYHALSYVYKYKMSDSLKADSIDKIILSRFPESQYSEFILDRNTKKKKEAVKSVDPMKEKFLAAEKFMYSENYQAAIDTLLFIAEKDSGNEWGGKARYAISWIYEKKIQDKDKAIESYTMLSEEYPRSDYAKIAKNKIKIPVVEVPVDTTKSDSTATAQSEQISDENKNPEEDMLPEDETKENETEEEMEDKKKEIER